VSYQGCPLPLSDARDIIRSFGGQLGECAVIGDSTARPTPDEAGDVRVFTPFPRRQAEAAGRIVRTRAFG